MMPVLVNMVTTIKIDLVLTSLWPWGNGKLSRILAVCSGPCKTCMEMISINLFFVYLSNQLILLNINFKIVEESRNENVVRL